MKIASPKLFAITSLCTAAAFATISASGQSGTFTGSLSAEALNVPIKLGIQFNNDEVTLGWTTNSAFVLQSCPSAGGPYVDMPGAASPYTNAATGAQMFFRLRAAAAPGIYMGTITGPESAGDFALMVSSNGLGTVALGYDTVQGNGFLATGFQIAGDGSFTFVTPDGATVSGTFAGNTVSGTFSNEASEGINGTFSATIKPATGIQQANAGYYIGAYEGGSSGDLYWLLAADGTVFVCSFSPAEGDDAGTGTINAEDSLSATTFGGVMITGALNPTTRAVSGSWSEEE